MSEAGRLTNEFPPWRSKRFGIVCILPGTDCSDGFLRLVEPEECEIAAEMLHKRPVRSAQS